VGAFQFAAQHLVCNFLIVPKGVEMKQWSTLLTLSAAFTIGSGAVFAQVSTGSKGTMEIPLGYGVTVNEGSTIRRLWVVVNDPELPIALGNESAPVPKLADRHYEYEANYTVEISEAISAVEIRFILFDVWGERTKSLSATEITEIGVGSHQFSHKWRVSSENESAEFYASIAYIALVRTNDGDIKRADQDVVLAEAQKFSDAVTMGDLVPE